MITKAGSGRAAARRAGTVTFPRANGVRPAVPMPEIDPIEELRLRRWARENYVPAAARDARWHPVALAEMRLRDAEIERERADAATVRGSGRFVPLAPVTYSLDPPHLTPDAPHFLAAGTRDRTAPGPEWGLFAG